MRAIWFRANGACEAFPIAKSYRARSKRSDGILAHRRPVEKARSYDGIGRIVAREYFAVSLAPKRTATIGESLRQEISSMIFYDFSEFGEIFHRLPIGVLCRYIPNKNARKARPQRYMHRILPDTTTRSRTSNARISCTTMRISDRCRPISSRGSRPRKWLRRRSHFASGTRAAISGAFFGGTSQSRKSPIRLPIGSYVAGTHDVSRRISKVSIVASNSSPRIRRFSQNRDSLQRSLRHRSDGRRTPRVPLSDRNDSDCATGSSKSRRTHFHRIRSIDERLGTESYRTSTKSSPRCSTLRRLSELRRATWIDEFGSSHARSSRERTSATTTPTGRSIFCSLRKPSSSRRRNARIRWSIHRRPSTSRRPKSPQRFSCPSRMPTIDRSRSIPIARSSPTRKYRRRVIANIFSEKLFSPKKKLVSRFSDRSIGRSGFWQFGETRIMVVFFRDTREGNGEIFAGQCDAPSGFEYRRFGIGGKVASIITHEFYLVGFLPLRREKKLPIAPTTMAPMAA